MLDEVIILTDSRPQWKAPVVPGIDCSDDEWVCRYVDFICNSLLWDKLPQLQGSTLVCDCPWQSLCEADLLAGLVFEATAPVQHPVVAQAGGPARRAGARRAVMLAASVNGATGIPMPITPFPWSQESVILAFRKLFPASWFDSVSFPWIEDLITQPPFTLFQAWLNEQDLDWDGPLVPQNASRQGRLLSRTRVLRHHQTPAIRAVTTQRDLGLVALLILLSSWSDTGYPFGLIKGLPAVGFAPHYGIFPLQEATPLRIDAVLEGWESHNARILASLKPGKDDSFLLSQSMQDAEKGFCSVPLTRSQLLQSIRAVPHRLIPRCVITQSSGKQRIIDNADDGGQSERSSDSNKLVLCSPFRPAQQIAWVISRMTAVQLAEAVQQDEWLSGGEDWPDAYRHSPMGEVDALGCVVTWWHEQWQQPAFQLYTGLLFGLPLAVTSFNRYSRLVEALGRRLCLVLVSMYFDDANIVDWKSSGGSGQAAFNTLNELLGTPFALEKKQLMSPEGTFLGLVHQLKDCMALGRVTFWVNSPIHSHFKEIGEAIQLGCLA